MKNEKILKIDQKNNQTHGGFSKISLFKNLDNHQKPVYSLCILPDGRLASCSLDTTIKIYNLNTYECEETLNGHTGYVLDVHVINNEILASSSGDSTIKLWRIVKGKYFCIKTLEHHSSAVNRTIQISNQRLASCSDDKEINVWESLEPFSFITVLAGHIGCVNSIIELKNNKYIVSGDFNRTLRFWDSKTYQCKKELNNIYCCSRNSFVEIDKNRLIVGEWSLLSIINTETLQLETKIKFSVGVGCIRSLLKFKDNTIICGCEKQFIQIDTDSYFSLLSMEDLHDYDITGMLLYKNTLFSCSYDSTIKIWKF